MKYNELEEKIQMSIRKEINRTSNIYWQQLSMKNNTIYVICEINYEQESKILKEELNLFFNFRLIKTCHFKIISLFTINNNIKKEYIHPYLNNKILHSIKCENIFSEISSFSFIDKNNIYLVSTTNNMSGIEFGYEQNNRLFLLSHVIKRDIAKPNIFLSINTNILNTNWKFKNYKLLENNNQILCKLQM
jgi:hypothetical protein